MRDEKRRVYQLNLGKSSYVSEDLPVESLYLNKVNLIFLDSLNKIRHLYFKNNNLVELNPNFNPALQPSPTNRKYRNTNNRRIIYPNLQVLGNQKNNELINKNCVSNSKTLEIKFMSSIARNRYFINSFKTNYVIN